VARAWCWLAARLYPVPAPVGDPGEFLDVDVDQLARGGVFVAADDPAGGPVQPAQPGQPVAGQHPVHGGRVLAEQPALFWHGKGGRHQDQRYPAAFGFGDA
jgi:hypothetical protein